MNPTPEEVQSALERWQKRLRLRDWRVEVRLCHRCDIQDGCAGSIDPNRYTREALIRLAYPVEVGEDESPIHRDWEIVLLHELLHLHWIEYSRADGKDSKELVEERACNDIAAALVMLSREAETRGRDED